MTVKFWYADGSCSLAVRISLNEIGASFEGVRTVMGKDGTQSEEFGRINPKRRVPVLSIDGHVIAELPAVLTAVSTLSPRHELMGTSTLEVIRAYEWLAWLTGTLHGQGFGSLWRPARFSDDPDTHASISRKGRQTVEECYAMLESRLSGAYSVGSKFSCVDALLFVYYTWGNMIGLDMARYENYSRVVDVMITRKSVVEAMKLERVSINGAQDLPGPSNP